MTTIIIPAAGDNHRWGRDYPKQMAQIGGESIINRLIRQCQDVGITPLALAHDVTLIAHLSTTTTIVNPARRRWLVETLISSQTYWEGRLIVLLGDVVMHPRLLQWILSDARPLQFYGTQHEIFALQCRPSAHLRLSNALQVALGYAEDHPADSGAGKLWSVYKALTGQPQREEVAYIQPHFTFVRDEYTTDIDTVADYERFMQDVVGQGMLGEVGV